MYPLPHDLFYLLMGSLDFRDIVRFTRVCKAWNKMGKDERLWKPLTLSYFPGGKYKEKTWYENFKIQYMLLTLLNPPPWVQHLRKLRAHDADLWSGRTLPRDYILPIPLTEVQFQLLKKYLPENNYTYIAPIYYVVPNGYHRKNTCITQVSLGGTIPMIIQRGKRVKYWK